MPTTRYQIESEILIEAPVEVVWRTVTEPSQITQWFAPDVELAAEPGARGHIRFSDDEGGPLLVETVEPPTRFSFWWNHPTGAELEPGNAVLVEFILVSEGAGRTRLRVTESGLEPLAWSDAEKQRYADGHNEGWADFIGRLAQLLAPQA